MATKIKIELINEHEFKLLTRSVAPTQIKKHDGFCAAQVGDTVYIFPEFDFRTLVIDTITTAAALRLRRPKSFSDQKIICRDIYRLFENMTCREEVAKAGTELLMYLIGKKMGVVALSKQFRLSQIEMLQDFNIDHI